MQIGGATSSLSPAAAALSALPASPASFPDSPGRLSDHRPARITSPAAGHAQRLTAELVSRYQLVRVYAAAGGPHAGAPSCSFSYSYSRGPDGQRYVVARAVAIDLGPVPNDPEATLRKMEVVTRAAPSHPLRIAAWQPRLVSNWPSCCVTNAPRRCRVMCPGRSRMPSRDSPIGHTGPAGLQPFRPQDQSPMPVLLIDLPAQSVAWRRLTRGWRKRMFQTRV